jgi:hypothetical protein
MLSLLVTKVKKNLYVIGAALAGLAYFVIRILTLKKARDRAEDKVDILKTTIHAERVKKEIIKEEEKKRVSRRADLLNELEKDGEDFKGLDNLNNPNDY